jgi:hypothetical protein
VFYEPMRFKKAKKRGKNTNASLPPTLCHEKALHDKSTGLVEKTIALDGIFLSFF